MAKHTLYAYVEGFDLDEISQKIISSFDHFISSRNWLYENNKIVNQRHLDYPTLEPGDTPNWDLGLNIDLPDPGKETLGWFSDIIEIATFLGELNEQTGRDFVIGIGDNDSGISEDLFYVDTTNPILTN